MNYKINAKKYYGHIFLIPTQDYLERMKTLMNKYKLHPKSLKQLKRLALLEAKKQSSGINFKHNSSKSIISKESVIRVLESTYDSINPLFIKLNHNFKNERRSVYSDNDKYLETIRKFETNKTKLFKYTIKNICKNTKLDFKQLERSVFYYIAKKDTQVLEAVNKSYKIGKHFAMAPHNMKVNDLIEILHKYYQNLNFLINSSKNSELARFALIIVGDVIYEYYGIEEEQVFAYIEEQNLYENPEVKKYIDMIGNIVQDNLKVVFNL